MYSEKYLDLKAKYNAGTDEAARIDILIDLAMEVRSQDVEEAIELADEIIARSKDVQHMLGLGRGYNLRGWCYWQKGNYPDGLHILEQALAISEQLRNKPLEARALNNSGYIYRDKGELSSALYYFRKALSINEALGDEVAMAVNLSSIASLHYDLGDYENALEVALRSLQIFSEDQDTYRLSAVNHLLGNIYFKLENYDEALQYYQENLKTADADSVGYALALSGLGKVLFRKGEHSKAAKYLHQAADLAVDLEAVEAEITSHFYLGKINIEEESYRTARKNLMRCFELASEYERKHDLMSIHEVLSVLYDRMGDIPKAFYHLKTFEALKEEIFKQTTFNKLRNLQSRQQIELAKKEKEVAEKTAALKQQFMANMSHEIRTPMNAIVGMTRLLQQGEPKPEQVRYLKAIQQSADNLLVIINDILDLSKIEAGRVDIEMVPYNLRELLGGVYDILVAKAREKGIAFKTVVDEQLPQMLNGDPTRITQVMINLAGNAVKFTENGSVEIHVSGTENGRHLRFDIVDTGIGIAPDYLEKIFDSFTQAGSDTTRKYGGTGLGLTISRQLTSLMGGELQVQSKMGEGTTFSVLLPLEPADGQTVFSAEQAAQANATSQNHLLENAVILLVEDNEFNQIVAIDSLHQLFPKMEIDTAENGVEAVAAVQKRNYNLVLMDIQMPVMDGVQATKTIRQLPGAGATVPIIAMTANVLQADVQKYQAAGMNGHVSKPFEMEQLVSTMVQNLQLQAAPVQQSGQEEQPAVFSPENASLPRQITNQDFLKTFTGGRLDKMQKYIGMFLENAPRLLHTMQAALETGDMPALKIAAHSLKPQLGYMGVKEEVSNIFLIEQKAGGAGNADRLPALLVRLQQVCTQAFQELNTVA